MSSSVISESARQNIPSITDIVHAVQFVRKMRGGSQPALIRCDDGKLYVVKFFNNPQGPNVLANEVLGNELLNVLHLPSPQWKMVFISRSFIKKNTGIFFETHSGYSAIEGGLHFGSEFLGDERTGQVYEWLPNAFCSRVANSKDFLGISIFDVWTNHYDHRQSLYTTGDGNASFLAVFGGPEWTRKSRQDESLSLDKRFHSNEWSAAVAESWIARFETECASSLFKIIQLVPRFWYSGDINQVAEFLIRRLSILRALLSEELTRKRMIFNPSHVDLTDARLSLHRFESPFLGTSKRGRLCVLLLEYVEDDGSRQRKSYLLSDLIQLDGDMLPSAREWIISVLTEIGGAQFDPHLSTDEMFSRYSFLDVGPLRTTCSGSFPCISLSKALASIKESVMSEAWSESGSGSGGGCFPDLLLPLDQMTLRSIRTRQKCHSQLQKSS